MIPETLPFNRRCFAIGLLVLASTPFSQAKEFVWKEANCVISMEVPPGWKTVKKAFGERAYTWLIESGSGKHAEMSLSLTQYSSRAGETEKDLEGRLGSGVVKTLRAGQGYNMMKFPMRQGIGRMSQFNKEALRWGVPFEVNHPILRLAYCTLDANCGLVGIMQMDDANSAEAAAMLDIISRLTLARRGPSTVLDVVAKDDHYTLSVPAGRVRLSFPKSGLAQVEATGGGATDSPRYFYFVDAAHGFQVSGWLENARLYKGIKDFWASEDRAARFKASSVSFERCGDWEVVYYELFDGQQISMRAECVRDDTWIDLHCSVLGAASKAAARDALLKFVRSSAIDTKEPDPIPLPSKS